MAAKNKSLDTIEQTVSTFIDAGIGLAMLPFSIAQNTMKSTKRETSQQFQSLQARGEKIDETLRNTLKPSNFCNIFTNVFTPKSDKAVKLEQLSQKVDTLVELVATIAAKQAAEKASTTKKPPATRRRAASSKTTKTTAVKASSSAAETKKEPKA